MLSALLLSCRSLLILKCSSRDILLSWLDGISYVAELPPVSTTAATVLGALGAGASTADEIARATGFDAATAAAALTELELARIVHASGGVYRR